MIDELPQGWGMASLSDIAEINPRHPRDLDDDLLVSFAPMPALSESRPEFNGLRERPLREVRKGFTHFAEGDVLFAKITPCMENGKAAVATRLRNGLGCGTTEVHVLRPLGGIEPFYIYHFIHQPSFRRAAEANFTGTAGQLRVPVAFVEKAEVPLPPLNEQRRIVAKLEKLLDKVDACQQRLAKIPVLLKRFRQSVLAAACSGRLTADWREKNVRHGSADEFVNQVIEKRQLRGLKQVHIEQRVSPNLPTDWLVVNLGAFIDSMANGLYKPEQFYADTGVACLRMYNIDSGRVVWKNIKRMILTAEEYERYALVAGDLLVNRVNSRELVGKAALIEVLPEPAVFESKNIRVRFLENCWLPRFVNYCFQTNLVRDRFEGDAKQTVGMATISQPQISSLALPIPPLSEQEEIVRRVEALFTLADQIEARYAKAKAHVDKLTQSILAKAFRGKLVPQDPNDEPASVLLERIRRTKSNDQTKRKTERAILGSA